jgi:hypothetical protein
MARSEPLKLKTEGSTPSIATNKKYMKRFLSLLVTLVTLFTFLSLGMYVYNNYYVETLVLYVVTLFAFDKYRKYLLNQIDYTFFKTGD